MTILEQLAQSKPPAAARRIPQFYEMYEGLDELPDLEWLIDGLLPYPTLAVLAGAPANGKSFLAIDLALTIASAAPEWRGRKVKHTPIAYIAGEGVRGMKKRVNAWKTVHPDAVFRKLAFLSGERIQMNEEDPFKDLVMALDRLPAKPGLIIIDTLHTHSTGMEENSSKEMGIWLAHAHELRERYEATILIVHHTSKAGNVRGSISLEAAVDTTLIMHRDTPMKGIFELEVKKQKDGEEGEPMHFKLIPVLGSAVIVNEEKPEKPVTDLDKRVNELLDDPEENLADASRKLALEFPDIFKGKNPQEASRSRLKRVQEKREKATGREGAATGRTVH